MTLCIKQRINLYKYIYYIYINIYITVKKDKEERTCDPSKNNYRNLMPAGNFDEKTVRLTN